MKQLLSILMIAAAASASAEILTPAQALERALGSEETAGNIRKVLSLRKGAKVTPALTVGDADAPELYIMTPTSETMVIVSAESEVPALLGYSDNGAFDPADMPPAMQVMLDAYAREIQAVRAGEAVYASGARATREAVMPLCRTAWNQSAPYNYYCPKINGNATMTGCVATAMAQVLKTLEWPAKCNGGTESYDWRIGGKKLSLDFNNVEFAWENMSDIYTSTSITYSAKAVATLMQALGYAAHMDYSTVESGAFGIELAAGLVNHFDYDCTLSYELHEWYTQDQWEGMIHNELMAGIPVYCDGINPDETAGHAFVIDGYQGDGFFHLNWGWGGLSDGYYRLTALDPVSQGIGGSSSGYNFGQGIIVGLKKGATTERALRPLIFGCYGQFECEVSSSTKGKSVKFTSGGFFNMSPLPSGNLTPGVRFVNNATGAEVDMKSTASVNQEIPSTYGFTDYNVTISSTLPDGKYTVYPIVVNNKDNKAYVMRANVGGYGQLNATVAGTKVSFSEPDHASIKATDIKVTSKLYPNTAFTASAKISNNTAVAFNGAVTPVILDRSTGKAVQVFDRIAIELSAGQSKWIEPTNVLDSKIAPGSYIFVLTDDAGYKLGLEIGVTVESRPAAGVMRYDGLKVIDTAKNNLTFEVTASCQSGYYAQPYFVVIYPASATGNYLDYFMSTPVIVAEGEQKTIELSGNFAKGKVGTTYTAIAYYMQNSSSNIPMVNAAAVKFTLTDGDYGISGIEAVSDNSDTPTEWFDLQGRKIAEPKSGIAIRRQGGKSKVIRL